MIPLYHMLAAYFIGLGIGILIGVYCYTPSIIIETGTGTYTTPPKVDKLHIDMKGSGGAGSGPIVGEEYYK